MKPATKPVPTAPSLSRRPAVTGAYILAVGITIAALAVLWLRPVLSGESLNIGEDYATFHGAALLVADGDGANMYDPAVLSKSVADATGATEVPNDYFGHFPFFAFFFVPLSLLPFDAAFLAFTVLGLVVLAAMLSRMGVERAGAALGLTLLSFSGFWTLDRGQMGFLVAALLFGVYLTLRSQRFFAAGLLLGLLAFKFPYAVGIGCWWVLRPVHYRKAIGGAALSAGSLVLSGFLVPGAWSEYWALMSEGLRLDKVTQSGFSIFEMLLELLDSETAALIVWVVVSAAVIAIFARTIRQLDYRLEPSLALAVVMGLLISPRIGWYDWVLLVVPAVLLWQTYPRLRSQLVVVGAWVYVAAAISFQLANEVDDAVGVFIQLAPLVLAGVTVWWVRLLLGEAEESGVDSPEGSAVV